MAIEGPIIQGSGQPLDSDLTSLAATGTAANKTVYTTSAHVWAETDITAAGRSMIGAANAGAQAALLTTLAPLASPTFTGTPAAPTAGAGTNTTQLATTAFVTTAVAASTHRFTVPEVWYRNNIPANLAQEAMLNRIAITTAAWVAPRAGSIVSVTTKLNDTITAGGVDVTVTINGSDAAAAIVAHTAAVKPTGGTVTVAAGTDTYAAGDLIAVDIATDAGFLPNATADIEVWVQVLES